MSAAAEPAATRWTAVLAATLCGVAVAMNVGKVPIAMPELRSEFGLSLVEAGWVSSMFNTLTVITGVLFGVTSDRVGALRTCFTGLALSALGGLAGILSVDGAALLASRFCEGAGYLAVAVSAPALLSAASRAEDRRFALGIWATYLPAGVGLTMITAPLLLRLEGWRGVWAFQLFVLVFAAAAIHACRRDYRGSRPGEPRAQSTDAAARSFAQASAALRQPAAWLLALAFGSFTAQHFALIIWLPTFLREQRGYPATTVSLLASLMIIVNIPGNLLGGALVQRNFRRGRLIAAASLATGLCGIGIFSAALPDGLRYALCLALSFFGGIVPAAVISSSAVLARSPQQVGTLQGLFMQGSNLGQFLSPPLIAALVAASGDWHDALWVTASAAGLGIGLGLALGATGFRESPGSPGIAVSESAPACR